MYIALLYRCVCNCTDVCTLCVVQIHIHHALYRCMHAWCMRAYVRVCVCTLLYRCVYITCADVCTLCVILVHCVVHVYVPCVLYRCVCWTSWMTRLTQDWRETRRLSSSSAPQLAVYLLSLSPPSSSSMIPNSTVSVTITTYQTFRHCCHPLEYSLLISR